MRPQVGARPGVGPRRCTASSCPSTARRSPSAPSRSPPGRPRPCGRRSISWRWWPPAPRPSAPSTTWKTWPGASAGRAGCEVRGRRPGAGHRRRHPPGPTGPGVPRDPGAGSERCRAGLRGEAGARPRRRAGDGRRPQGPAAVCRRRTGRGRGGRRAGRSGRGRGWASRVGRVSRPLVVATVAEPVPPSFREPADAAGAAREPRGVPRPARRRHGRSGIGVDTRVVYDPVNVRAGVLRLVDRTAGLLVLGTHRRATARCPGRQPRGPHRPRRRGARPCRLPRPRRLTELRIALRPEQEDRLRRDTSRHRTATCWPPRRPSFVRGDPPPGHLRPNDPQPVSPRAAPPANATVRRCDILAISARSVISSAPPHHGDAPPRRCGPRPCRRPRTPPRALQRRPPLGALVGGSAIEPVDVSYTWLTGKISGRPSRRLPAARARRRPAAPRIPRAGSRCATCGSSRRHLPIGDHRRIHAGLGRDRHSPQGRRSQSRSRDPPPSRCQRGRGAVSIVRGPAPLISQRSASMSMLSFCPATSMPTTRGSRPPGVARARPRVTVVPACDNAGGEPL